MGYPKSMHKVRAVTGRPTTGVPTDEAKQASSQRADHWSKISRRFSLVFPPKADPTLPKGSGKFSGQQGPFQRHYTRAQVEELPDKSSRATHLAYTPHKSSSTPKPGTNVRDFPLTCWRAVICGLHAICRVRGRRGVLFCSFFGFLTWGPTRFGTSASLELSDWPGRSCPAW